MYNYIFTLATLLDFKSRSSVNKKPPPMLLSRGRLELNLRALVFIVD